MKVIIAICLIMAIANAGQIQNLLKMSTEVLKANDCVKSSVSDVIANLG